MKKGETYTFSMYVKAEISALESVGKCFLRAQCYDKDGKSMQYDSEAIRRTTDGFLQLSVFFTVPKDAKNDTVNLYLHLYHVKGTLYGWLLYTSCVGQMRAEYKQQAKLHDVIFPAVHREEGKVLVLLNDEGGKPYAVVEFTEK